MLDAEIISLKLTMLLALTDAKRDYEIQKLDIKYMVKTFHIFPEEESLCPYKALNHYLEVTNFWQIKGYRNQLLFSHIETHQPISSPTIARWIKTVLSLAGIEILSLKRSLCQISTTTSKSKFMKLSTKDIIKKGKLD